MSLINCKLFESRLHEPSSHEHHFISFHILIKCRVHWLLILLQQLIQKAEDILNGRSLFVATELNGFQDLTADIFSILQHQPGFLKGLQSIRYIVFVQEVRPNELSSLP